MSEKYLLIVILTVLSIGISNLSVSYAQYASPYTNSGINPQPNSNSQSGTLTPNTNSSTSTNYSKNAQAAANLNSQPGTLASTLAQNSATPNSTSNSSSQNAIGGNLIIFTETGLRTGWGACWSFWSCVPSWSITHNNQTASSTTNTLSISSPSGDYSYTVVSPREYSATPLSGKLMVNGMTNQTIHFILNQ